MFHKSNYGSFGGGLPADMDGYVPEEGDDAFAGNWDHGGRATHHPDGTLTEYGEWWESEGFPDLLERATEVKERADEQLAEWRSR